MKRAATLPRLAVKESTCPECGSRPTKKCKDVVGRQMKLPHSARLRLQMQKAQQGQGR